MKKFITMKYLTSIYGNLMQPETQMTESTKPSRAVFKREADPDSEMKTHPFNCRQDRLDSEIEKAHCHCRDSLKRVRAHLKRKMHCKYSWARQILKMIEDTVKRAQKPLLPELMKLRDDPEKLKSAIKQAKKTLAEQRASAKHHENKPIGARFQ
jgi:hypothetical protein